MGKKGERCIFPRPLQHKIEIYSESNYRMGRNFYSGLLGDSINVMLSAAAFNFKRAIIFFALYGNGCESVKRGGIWEQSLGHLLAPQS